MCMNTLHCSGAQMRIDWILEKVGIDDNTMRGKDAWGVWALYEDYQSLTMVH